MTNQKTPFEANNLKSLINITNNNSHNFNGQSAIEYLMTYGWTILLIAVALVTLFGLGFLNTGGISNTDSCIAQAGYLCSNPILNTAGNLTINFGDITQVQSLIVTGVACIKNNTLSQTNFNNTYLKIYAGEKTTLQFVCPLISNSIGAKFTGTLWIRYNTGSVSNQISKLGKISVKVTTSNSSGTVDLQQSTLYSVPISLVNSQSIATQAPFQQMLVIDSAKYSQYINTNWNNVEFTTGNVAAGNPGTILEAWAESGVSNTATNTIVWIKLPNGIPALSTVTIYINFLTTNIMSSSGPTGEAPELSTPYAAYDNGNMVFNFYENFAGNELTTNLWKFNNEGILQNTYEVNNGLYLYPAGTSYYNFIAINTSQGVFLNNEIADFYAQWGKPISGAYATINFGSGQGIAIHTQLEGGNGNLYLTLCGYNSKPYSFLNYNYQYSSNGGCQLTNYPYSYSLVQQPAEIYSIAHNGTDPGTGIVIQQGTQTSRTIVYWIRTRAQPPNNAMPGQISILANTLTSEIYQGASNDITSLISGGNAPYTYQWYIKSPGQSKFTPISGATYSSYTFSTTSSTLIGKYTFMLNATDSFGEQASSNNVSILVLPSEPVTYIPITLSNQQNIGTTTDFQQMIYFNPSTYSNYLYKNLSNIEFTSGSPAGTYGGTPLYSWIESGASSSASNTVIWVNLGGNVIGASGSNSNTITIYMNFLSDNSPIDLGISGYAPELWCQSSCFQNTYGQYDNGYNIFPFYDNFKILNLSKWSENNNAQPGAFQINNGLTMNSLYDPTFAATTLTSYAPIWTAGTTLDIYGKYGKIIENAYASLGLGNQFSMIYGLFGINNPYMYLYGSSGNIETNYPTGSGSPIPTNGIYSVMRIPGNIISMFNYSNQYSILNTYSASYPYYFISGYEVEPSTFYWVRSRSSPPNGVMPQFSLGSIN